MMVCWAGVILLLLAGCCGFLHHVYHGTCATVHKLVCCVHVTSIFLVLGTCSPPPPSPSSTTPSRAYPPSSHQGALLMIAGIILVALESTLSNEDDGWVRMWDVGFGMIAVSTLKHATNRSSRFRTHTRTHTTLGHYCTRPRVHLVDHTVRRPCLQVLRPVGIRFRWGNEGIGCHGTRCHGDHGEPRSARWSDHFP